MAQFWRRDGRGSREAKLMDYAICEEKCNSIEKYSDIKNGDK
jgi:hypothetical protein